MSERLTCSHYCTCSKSLAHTSRAFAYVVPRRQWDKGSDTPKARVESGQLRQSPEPVAGCRAPEPRRESAHRKSDSIHHHHTEGVVYRGFCLNSGTVAVSKVSSRRWWCMESVFPTQAPPAAEVPTSTPSASSSSSSSRARCRSRRSPRCSSPASRPAASLLSGPDRPLR